MRKWLMVVLLITGCSESKPHDNCMEPQRFKNNQVVCFLSKPALIRSYYCDPDGDRHYSLTLYNGEMLFGINEMAIKESCK